MPHLLAASFKLLVSWSCGKARDAHPAVHAATPISCKKLRRSIGPTATISLRDNQPRLVPMKILLAFALCVVSTGFCAEKSSWDPKAAAAYLDQRAAWWITWKPAARDHDTFCISCHTSLTYALGRPALRSALARSAPSTSEQQILDNVRKRVRMWAEVEPFYND